MTLRNSAVAFVLALAWALGCASTVGGGSQTSWQSCKTSDDCRAGMVCVAQRCESAEAGLMRDAEAGSSTDAADAADASDAARDAADFDAGPLSPVDEVTDLPGRFGIAYRAKSGDAMFLEYVDGLVTTTPLGVPGTPRFTYDPAGQAIFVVPFASREDMTRINAAVVPQIDVPLVGAGEPLAIVATARASAGVLQGTVYSAENGRQGDFLAGMLESLREQDLSAGRDGHVYVSLIAGSGPIPSAAYVALAVPSPWGDAWRVADGGVSIRSAAATDGTLHAIHHCSTTPEAPLVGRLCHSSSPKEREFVDGGADAHPTWSHATLGQVYEAVDAARETSGPLFAAIALDGAEAPHIALLRPSGRGFRIAYQPAPLDSSAPDTLGVAEPLTPPELHVATDGTASIAVHDTETRFTLYAKDGAGWHATHVDVPDLGAVGSVRIAR